jgi:Short C-terminal domain
MTTTPMRQLSAAGQKTIDDIAQRHGFGVDATLSMLYAVIDGNGSMAQFNHPEFSGSGQWMRNGMTMVSDMFNNQLKARVDALCVELSSLMASQPELIHSGNHRSSDHWWPSDLRSPNSTGAQNDVRYAYFAQLRRLAIDIGGKVTVYDTLDHEIGGFSQQQSGRASLSFSSQHGPIQLASLPVVSSGGEKALTKAAPPRENQPESVRETRDTATAFGQDVFAAIEKLADLKAKGIISDEEFSAKKTELLNRV